MKFKIFSLILFLEFPLGQVPILEIDGVILQHSLTICRYLGNLYNLNGDNPWEASQIDVAADTINDLRLSKHFTYNLFNCYKIISYI